MLSKVLADLYLPGALVEALCTRTRATVAALATAPTRISPETQQTG